MKIKILENGPVILETKEGFTLQVEGSSEQKDGPIALCRCGQSADKPFCDGSHRTAGFEAPAAELTTA